MFWKWTADDACRIAKFAFQEGAYTLEKIARKEIKRAAKIGVFEVQITHDGFDRVVFSEAARNLAKDRFVVLVSRKTFSINKKLTSKYCLEISWKPNKSIKHILERKLERKKALMVSKTGETGEKIDIKPEYTAEEAT